MCSKFIELSIQQDKLKFVVLKLNFGHYRDVSRNGKSHNIVGTYLYFSGFDKKTTFTLYFCVFIRV